MHDAADDDDADKHISFYIDLRYHIIRHTYREVETKPDTEIDKRHTTKRKRKRERERKRERD